MFGSVALYSCDKRYELMGDANRTCGENELWSGEQPTCISMLISYHIQLLHYLHERRKENTNDVLCIHIIKTVCAYMDLYILLVFLLFVMHIIIIIMNLHNKSICPSQIMGTYYFPVVCDAHVDLYILLILCCCILLHVIIDNEEYHCKLLL